MERQPIKTAPFDRELELAVTGPNGVHALAFPCRRVLGGWMKSETRARIEVRPTHWRAWSFRQAPRPSPHVDDGSLRSGK